MQLKLMGLHRSPYDTIFNLPSPLSVPCLFIFVSRVSIKRAGFSSAFPPPFTSAAILMDASLSGATIAKLLASCNKSARDRAVRTLSSWLPGQTSGEVSDADLVKIWKGLFYCFWHSDKMAVQVDLANRLASLLEDLGTPLAVRYFDVFVLTIRREWGGIDFLRLDKFYLLIRRFLRHAFLLLRKKSWEPTLTAELIGKLSEKSLLASDKHPSNGVNYHIAEVFLDELKDSLPLPVETLEIILKPFVLVLEKSADKVLVNKVKANVFGKLLENGSSLLSVAKAGEQAEPGSEVNSLGKVFLGLGLSKKFFDSASASETLQANRKVLFGLHDDFSKLEKNYENSGVVIAVQHLENGKAEKRTELMVSESAEPTMAVTACKDGGSDGKPVKKRKKMKNSSNDVDTDDKLAKKTKKSKKASDSMEKKKTKSKKNKSLDSSTENNAVDNSSDAGCDVNGLNLNGTVVEPDERLSFDEHVISNLQKQFEKVAAEVGMENDNDNVSPLAATPALGLKSRRRAKSEGNANDESSPLKSSEMSGKKVRFSMKHNLVWKPQNPLPPQSLRLPPSATPRGSALKKGVPPGPISKNFLATKKTRKVVKVKSSKKIRKGARILQLPSTFELSIAP